MSNNRTQEAHEQRIKTAIIDGRNRGVCDKDGNTIPRVSVGRGRKADSDRAFRESSYWDNK